MFWFVGPDCKSADGYSMARRTENDICGDTQPPIPTFAPSRDLTALAIAEDNGQAALASAKAVRTNYPNRLPQKRPFSVLLILQNYADGDVRLLPINQSASHFSRRRPAIGCLRLTAAPDSRERDGS